MILEVVDRLSKYDHFISFFHPFTALMVAQLFMENIYRLHRVPTSIVFDRHKVFMSSFWKDLFKLIGIDLKFSTAYHP